MKISTNWTLSIIVLAVIGALVLIGFRSVAVEAVYPVERVHRVFMRKVMSRLSGCLRGAEAQAENVRLRREVASLVMDRADQEQLEAENARLRKALDYKERSRESWVASAILSFGGGAAGVHNAVRVDKGSLDGVQMGAVAVVPEGLVGKVTYVTLHTAEVTLITDGLIKVACEVETEGKRLRGILSGGSEDSLLLRHLSDGAEAPPRSRVLTSGLGGVFPRGIVVGTLLEVRKDAGGLASEGEVLPAVDFSTLEDVFIRCDK